MITGFADKEANGLHCLDDSLDHELRWLISDYVEIGRKSKLDAVTEEDLHRLLNDLYRMTDELKKYIVENTCTTPPERGEVA